MAAPCPVCETVNDAATLDCVTCGRTLRSPTVGAGGDIAPIDGLEMASFAAETARAREEDTIEGLEVTHHAPVRVVLEERLIVELAVLPPTGEVEIELTPDLDRGRAAGIGDRAPAPDKDGPCPYCGVPGTAKICENCGRRRGRYSEAPAGPQGARAAQPEYGSCPGCLGRILWTDRCSECGMPLPPRELF